MAQEPVKPEPVRTSITVAESVTAETPAGVSALDHDALQQIPGVNLDDRLRIIPGFSLFRRSSSVVAHPTTQGVSLRGIGSSGASRTLVLWDGVPANDPFGGWVYWSRFLPEDTGRVEVERGGSVSAFGDLAMSGAIAIFSRAAESGRLLTSYRTGNREQQDAAVGYSRVFGRLAVSGAVRAFTTGGYFIVPAELRGAADRPAGVRFLTGNLRFDAHTRAGDFFLKFDALAEDRQNGTPFARNSTSLGTLSLRYAREFAGDTLSLTAWHAREQFHGSFTAVATDRATERLLYRQTVPAESEGGAGVWRRHRTRWEVLAGADANRAAGTSTDRLLPDGIRTGSGARFQHGVFAQADFSAGPARLFAGLRHSFAGAGDRFLSPSAGIVLGSRGLRARASVYRGFRAPTLNELYREFRAGNTETLANTALRPETLTGAEAGVDWLGGNSSLRVTLYRNALENLVTNVTLSAGPAGIVRRRENAAAALSHGVEAELRRRWRRWSAEAGYLFAESRFRTGPRVAQVPRHQGSGRLVFSGGGTLLAAGVRAYGYQFDDDLNRFRLPGFATFECAANKRLRGALSAEASLENALDRRYYTAFNPTPNTGAPRLWRVGLRWEGGVP